MNRLFAIGVFVAVMAALSVGSAALATSAGNDKADLIDTNALTVDCFGNGPAQGTGYGFVNAHRIGADLLINVHVRNALPNTTYRVGIRCVNSDTVMETNSNGVGNVTYRRPAMVVLSDCGGPSGGMNSNCGYGPVGTPITLFSVGVGTSTPDTLPGDNLTSRTLNP